MTLANCFRREWHLAIAMITGMCCQQLNAQITTEVLWQRCVGGSDQDYGFRVRDTGDGGIVCIGYGRSTDGDMAASNGFDDILVTKLDANGAVQWSRVLGGSSEDRAFDGIVASDGSIMVIGYTASNDGDVTGNHGDGDIWVVKLSPIGNLVWERAYGGSDTELAGAIQETTDGGFLISANTRSVDGDVVGFHPGSGFDVWVFKISASGSLEWNRAIGGSGHEDGARLTQTADGGVLVNVISTGSNDGDVTNFHGDRDCLVVKLNAAGVLEWSRAIGGSQQESSSDLLELSNGDILMVGYTGSSDGDVQANQGITDVLLAKLNTGGGLIWARTYGGSLGDIGSSIISTADGGFVIGSSSNSNNGDVSNNQGLSDAWVFKVDANGAIVWQHSIGGALGDGGRLFEDESGGYLLFGSTESYVGGPLNQFDGRDIWLAKLSTNGELRWQRPLGGSVHDEPKDMIQTSDNSFVACGFTSSNDGDVSGNHGGRDMWVVKLKVTEPTVPPECALFVPNAFSPNNSSKNDAHCIYGTDCVTSMTFNIFDRWGNKVFESTDPNACWDGTYNGQALDPAVFVYHLSATLANAEVVEKQGNITLVR